MEKKFNAVDYLKSDIINNFRMDILGNIIEWWEDWRCAVGYEDVFNLSDENEANAFCNLYGFKKTMECYKQNSFWLGGLNIKEPIELTSIKMYSIIADEYDEELFKEMLDCGYHNILEQWFNISKLMKDIYTETIVINVNDIVDMSIKDGIMTIKYNKEDK